MADPKEKTYREVVKKDNFFSVELYEGETVTIAVNGEMVITANVPDNSHLNSYLKRRSVAMLYKE